MSKYEFIGRSLPNVDVADKAKGAACFVGDIKLPRMLYGAVKRSPHSFAKITHIHTSKAIRLPGVKAVITADNITQHSWGHYVSDETPLATGYVRYIGDEVAAVAAVDAEIAEEALELIEVRYEELNPVLNVQTAMQSGAPAVHPECSQIQNNIAYHVDFIRGEGEDALKDAYVVLEEQFITPSVYHAYLECQGCISSWNSNGTLTVWAATQAPFRARLYLSQALGIPEHKIRVIQPPIGGGFGGKISINHIHPISAFLSIKTERPVKIILDRQSDILSCRAKLPVTIDLKMGFGRDGTIIAKASEILADTGASAGTSPAVLSAASVRPDCLYRIPNIKCVANLVYTNKVPRGSFRGYGNTETTFAQECLIDMAAVQLGIDPIELRLKNATQKGDVTAHGWIIDSCGLSESLRTTMEKSGWKEKRQNPRKNRGIGVACQVHVGGNRAVHPIYDGSAAIVRIDEYGKVHVVSGESEIGQGAHTIFTQIVAEEIGVKIEDITVLPVDSQYSPFALGAWASRTTQLAGNAVIMAAQDARRQLLQQAALQLDCKLVDLDIKDSIIYLNREPEKLATVSKVAFRAVFEAGGVPIMGRGAYTVPDYVVVPEKGTFYGNYSLGYSFSTQVAEVEVDPETGKVDALNMWVGEDVGRALNPKLCEGQIEGGVLQGIGGTLIEEYKWTDGEVINANFTDYKIPISADTPNIHSSLIETDNPGSPYGAKSIGEAVINPVAPAITNAIYNAIGVRMTKIPTTSERIRKALIAKGILLK